VQLLRGYVETTDLAEQGVKEAFGATDAAEVREILIEEAFAGAAGVAALGQSTIKYAQVLDQEVTDARAGLQVSRNYPGADIPESKEGRKVLMNKGNFGSLELDRMLPQQVRYQAALRSARPWPRHANGAGPRQRGHWADEPRLIAAGPVHGKKRRIAPALPEAGMPSHIVGRRPIPRIHSAGAA
jgi:hypothetical protein